MKKVLYIDELAHYGVLGMKWGVRKDDGFITNRNNARSKYKQSKKLYKAALKKANKDALMVSE